MSKKNKKNIISEDKLMKLLELLMTIDRDLPWEHLFKDDCHELFVLFFKVTFYGPGIQYSVENKKGEKVLEIDSHENLEWTIGSIQRPES